MRFFVLTLLSVGFPVVKKPHVGIIFKNEDDM